MDQPSEPAAGGGRAAGGEAQPIGSPGSAQQPLYRKEYADASVLAVSVPVSFFLSGWQAGP